MSERVARSRELVAQGFALAAVTRVLQVSRQAVYRTPTPRRSPQRRPVTDPVERAIVEVAQENQTDGYRMVWAMTRRKLGRAVNRKRVLRVMREQRLIQRRRPPAAPQAARRLSRRAAAAAVADRHDLDLGRRARLDLPERDHRLLHQGDRRRRCQPALSGQGGDRGDRAGRRRAGHPPGDADARHRQRLGVHREGHAHHAARASESLTAAAAIATPRARRSSSPGSQSSRSAWSGGWSSRPSNSSGPSSSPTSSATTTGPTRA